jgi:hypothetical protein
MRWLICILALPLFAADPLPEDRGAAGLWRSLLQLQTTARVLHIAAHPDDEDGPTITWLTRGRGADVTMLSLTRGESGANLVTGDFFDRLGARGTAPPSSKMSSASSASPNPTSSSPAGPARPATATATTKPQVSSRRKPSP